MTFLLMGAAAVAFAGYQEWRMARLARELRRQREDDARGAAPAELRARPTKDDIIATVEEAQRRGRLTKA